MYGSYYLTQQEYADYVQAVSLLKSYTVKPQLFIRYGRLKEPLRMTLDDLLTDTETTYADMATTLTEVVLANANGFSVNDFILMGEYLQEMSEIVQITALAGNVATISAIRIHPTGTVISRLLYDQIEISNSPNLGVTKTVLATLPLEADNDTFYMPTITSGFYYARYYNSFSTNFSDYSDGLPYIGYNKNMARAIIDNALMEINKTINEVLTDEYAFMQLANCLEEVQKESKRYSFYQINRYPIKAQYGKFTYDLPNNMLNRQVLYLEYNKQLHYLDNRDFNQSRSGYVTNYVPGEYYSGTFANFIPTRTNLSEPLSIGAGVVKVINSGDFPSRVDFVPTAPTIYVIGLTGTSQYTYTVEVNTPRGWSRQAGAQVVNAYDTLDYLNYNRLTIDEMANATEYRIYRTEGLTAGLLYQGPYITEFLDTGKSVIAPIESVQAIGTLFVSGMALPYIENENNIFTLQYPSPVSGDVGADVSTRLVIGDPSIFTIEDDKLVVYPAPGTERNFYMTYYSTNTTISEDQDTIPFDDTMLVVYYLQWKFLVKQNNGIETADSMAKKLLYEKRLYLLRTKDNNGVTKLKPIVRNWKN